jgi:hypothetical protein
MAMKSLSCSILFIILISSCNASEGNTIQVKIRNGDITLAGTLLTPERSGKVPGIVLVHGSGKSTWNFYKYYAERLAEFGFAVLYYDKRGVGKSEGRYSGISIENSNEMFKKLSSDARAAASWLRGRPETDPGRIGLFGISQAGWIIPKASAESEDINFSIIISGPVGSVGEEHIFSRLAGDEINEQKYSDQYIEKELRDYNGPHGYDSRDYIEKLTTPTLWIFGAADKSMPANLSVEYLLDIIGKYDKKYFSYKLFPHANHGIRNTRTGVRIDYFDEVINDWLQSNEIIN